MSSPNPAPSNPSPSDPPPSQPNPDQLPAERLALPAPPTHAEIEASQTAQQPDTGGDGEKVRTLNVQTEEGVQLDELGPVVVNSDGTISRISNWPTLTPLERERVLRLIGRKRNKERMEKIRGEE